MGNCCKKTNPAFVKPAELIKNKKSKERYQRTNDAWILYPKKSSKWINTKWAPRTDERIKAYAARIERMSYKALPTIGLRERELFLRDKFLSSLPLDVQKKLKSIGVYKWNEIVDRTDSILNSTNN